MFADELNILITLWLRYEKGNIITNLHLTMRNFSTTVIKARTTVKPVLRGHLWDQ